MTAWGLVDLCSRRGLSLRTEGNTLRLVGSAEARADLRDLLKLHKQEIVAILRAAGRPVMPPDDFGKAEWHRDWRGRPVNLFGVRKENHVLPN